MAECDNGDLESESYAAGELFRSLLSLGTIDGIDGTSVGDVQSEFFVDGALVGETLYQGSIEAECWRAAEVEELWLWNASSAILWDSNSAMKL